MNDDDRDPTPTPTTLPGKPRPSNGVVERPIAFEDTGEVAEKLYNSVSSESPTIAEEFLESLAKKLVEHGAKPGGGGGDGGDAHAKSIKRHNVLTLILALLLGPGGILVVLQLTSDRSKSNAQEVLHLKDLIPRVEKTEEDIQDIKISVGSVQTSVNSMVISNDSIVDGLDELKAENVTRLKTALEDAKQEVRQLKQRHR